MKKASARDMQTLSHYLSFILAMVLFGAGLAKLRLPLARRAGSLSQFKLIPAWLCLPLAAALPFIELLLGVLCLLPRFWFMCQLLVCAMLSVFTIVVSFEWLRGGNVNCGCFGEADATNTNPKIFFLRNGILIVAAISSVLLPPPLLNLSTVLIGVVLALNSILSFSVLTSILSDPTRVNVDGSSA